jgi:tetratricopeptide (TPR) repeat protein
VDSPSASGGYSAREVAALLNIPADKVRSFVHARLLNPSRGERGEYRFSFRDLVLLRSLKGLSDAHIPARRLRLALGRLKQQVPAERPLSGIAITAEEDRIVARDGTSKWNPESGQMAFEFPGRRASPVGGLPPEAVPPPAQSSDGLDAEGWYKLGCELEGSAPERACDAYCRAIELDARHADAHINLGRVLHHAGQVRAAEKHYRLAVQARPKDAVASFNLGIALEDLGRTDEAMQAYRDAIAADAACADAYFNLAHLYEQEGMRANAIRYLKTYRTLAKKG